MREFRSTAAPRLVALLWGLAAVGLLLFLVVRANPNAGLLLIAAAVLGGAGLVWVLTIGIQRLDRAEVGAWGYEREMLVLAFLLLSLAVPWRIELQVAKAGQIFGWSAPLAWLAALGLVPALSRRLRRLEPAGLALSGVALAAWFGWITWLTFTPAFRSLHFPFLPVDLLDYGWYLAVAAWAIAVDGAAHAVLVGGAPVVILSTERARAGQRHHAADRPGRRGRQRRRSPGRRARLAAGDGSRRLLPAGHQLLPNRVRVLGWHRWPAAVRDLSQRLRSLRRADRPGLAWEHRSRVLGASA